MNEVYEVVDVRVKLAEQLRRVRAAAARYRECSLGPVAMRGPRVEEAWSRLEALLALIEEG